MLKNKSNSLIFSVSKQQMTLNNKKAILTSIKMFLNIDLLNLK